MKRSNVAFLGCLVAIGVTAAACSGSTSAGSSSTTTSPAIVATSQAPTQSITGAVVLAVDDPTYGPRGNPCSGHGQYQSIQQGASLVVKDESGKIIGSGTLGPGTAEFSTTVTVLPGLEADYCHFFFTVNLPSAAFYQFQVADQPAKTLPASQVSAPLLRVTIP